MKSGTQIGADSLLQECITACGHNAGTGALRELRLVSAIFQLRDARVHIRHVTHFSNAVSNFPNATQEQSLCISLKTSPVTDRDQKWLNGSFNPHDTIISSRSDGLTGLVSTSSKIKSFGR